MYSRFVSSLLDAHMGYKYVICAFRNVTAAAYKPCCFRQAALPSEAATTASDPAVLNNTRSYLTRAARYCPDAKSESAADSPVCALPIEQISQRNVHIKQNLVVITPIKFVATNPYGHAATPDISGIK